jgi:hypothetical protein
MYVHPLVPALQWMLVLLGLAAMIRLASVAAKLGSFPGALVPVVGLGGVLGCGGAGGVAGGGMKVRKSQLRPCC